MEVGVQDALPSRYPPPRPRTKPPGSCAVCPHIFSLCPPAPAPPPPPPPHTHPPPPPQCVLTYSLYPPPHPTPPHPATPPTHTQVPRYLLERKVELALEEDAKSAARQAALIPPGVCMCAWRRGREGRGGEGVVCRVGVSAVCRGVGGGGEPQKQVLSYNGWPTHVAESGYTLGSTA
jgi:hypothetical protein